MKSKNKFDPSRLHVAGGGDEDNGDGGRVAMEDEDDFFLSLEHFLLWALSLSDSPSSFDLEDEWFVNKNKMCGLYCFVF